MNNAENTARLATLHAASRGDLEVCPAWLCRTARAMRREAKAAGDEIIVKVCEDWILDSDFIALGLIADQILLNRAKA